MTFPRDQLGSFRTLQFRGKLQDLACLHLGTFECGYAVVGDSTLYVSSWVVHQGWYTGCADIPAGCRAQPLRCLTRLKVLISLSTEHANLRSVLRETTSMLLSISIVSKFYPVPLDSYSEFFGPPVVVQVLFILKLVSLDPRQACDIIIALCIVIVLTVRCTLPHLVTEIRETHSLAQSGFILPGFF